MWQETHRAWELAPVSYVTKKDPAGKDSQGCMKAESANRLAIIPLVSRVSMENCSTKLNAAEHSPAEHYPKKMMAFFSICFCALREMLRMVYPSSSC